MFGSKKQKEVISKDELAFEKRFNSSQIKKLDKVYIVVACLLIVGWGAFALGGFNFLKSMKLPSFSFITDYFDHKSWDGNVKYVSPKFSYARVCGDYVVYRNSETMGLISLKRDGSEVKTILNNYNYTTFDVKDGWIYYYEADKGIMKMLPDGSEKNEVIKADLKLRPSQSFSIINNNIYYVTMDKEYYMSDLDGNNKKLLLYLSNGILEACPYSNWIYYYDNLKQGIYKMKIGEKEKILVLDTKDRFIGQLSVYRDHLYYLENTGLFRYSLDDSKETKIDSDVSFYAIEDSTLYYTRLTDKASGGPEASIESTIMSSKLDGSEKKELSKSNSFMAYIGDNIYFSRESLSGNTSFSDIGKDKVIKVPELELELLVKNWGERLKGAHPGKILNSINGYTQLAVDKNGFSYISSNIAGSGILKYRKDMDKPIQIGEDTGRSLKLLGNNLFYISENDNNLYVMSTKWPGSEKVFDFNIYNYDVREEGIYFYGPNSKLYKADFTTGRVEKLHGNIVTDYQIQGDYIYMSLVGYQGSVFKMKLDGTSREEIKLSMYPGNFTVKGDYIYLSKFTDEGSLGDLMRVNLKTQGEENIIKSLGGEYTITDKFIIFADHRGNVNGMPPIYLYDLEGSNKRELQLPRNDFNFFFEGNKAYYVEYPGVIKEYSLKQLIKK